MQSLTNIWFLALATFTEGIRHRALWAILCLAILLTMANLTVTSLYSWDLGKVSVEFGLSAVAFTGLLLIFFLGIKLLSDDLEHSRIFMLLSRPVSILQYLVGKFLGIVMILFLSTVILGSAAALSMIYVLWQYPAFVPPDFSWLIYVMALACQWMSLVVILAACMFFFSFASHTFIALLLSVSTYLIGQNMELLRQIVKVSTHAGILTDQKGFAMILSWVFPNLSFFDKKYIAAYGMPFSGQEFILLLLYAVSYSAILVYLASLLYRRKELT